MAQDLINFKIDKIVGVPQEKAWSQVHFFVPQGDKISTHGSLAASFSFSILTDGVDVASFGKEIILRFHEAYYSSVDPSALSRLKAAIQIVVDEFEEKVVLRIQAGVLVKNALYLALNSGQIYLFRHQQLILLLSAKEALKAASGLVQDSDRFVFGSEPFFDIVSQGTLRASLSSEQSTKTIDILTPMIHAHPNNSLAVMLLCDVAAPAPEKTDSDMIEKPEEDQPKPRFLDWKKYIHRIRLPNIRIKLSDLKSFLTNRPKASLSFRIRDEKLAHKAKRKTLLVAVVLVLMLAASLFFGSQKKKQDEFEQQRQKIIAPAVQAIEESTQWGSENPLRAKTILTQAQEELERQKNGQTDPRLLAEIEATIAQVEDQLSAVTGLQRIDEPELFLDLSLIKPDITAGTIDLSDQKLLVIAATQNTALLVDTGTKNYDLKTRSADSDQTKAAALVNSGQRLIWLTDKNLVVTDTGNDKIIQTLPVKENDGRKLIGFEGNVYLLEKQAILKYIGLDSGVSEARAYLKTKPSWTSKDMAIDGFVWVLGEDGQVYKYISGASDSFVTLGVEELSTDLMIYTDKNLESIYLLDKQKTKVFKIGKSGEYQKSYLWPGIAGVNDFVVSEEKGKIWLLTKDRIYTINLGNNDQ